MDGARAREPRAGERSSVARSAREFLRAAAGGLLVGLPLLFTMEVWWEGFILPWWKLLLLLGLAYLIVLGYNSLAGFRAERNLTDLFVDSLATIGLGMVLAAAAMLLLGRIEIGVTSIRDAAGKVLLESIPIAFGASLAVTQLAATGEDEGSDEEQGSGGGDADPPSPILRLFISAGGALLFALNVAPTDEPVMIGLETSWPLQVTTMAVTMIVTLAVVFYADFRGGRRPGTGSDVLGHPIAETVAAYAVSLGVSLLLLWAFDRTDGQALPRIVAMTVTLAVVASFGAAVGRLIVGSGVRSSRG